jgi:hypothetical protein
MDPSTPRTPERDKRPGLHYVLTADGIEVPVIDLTHPAFAFEPDDAEMERRIAAFVRQTRARERLPRLVSRLLVRIALRKSFLARGIRAAAGTFLSGVGAYLLKLGPELLGAGWAQPVDRRIADALPAVSMRLRMLDMARLLLAGVTPALAARRSPLHLVNLGGGPSPDSWNAVLMLRRDRPDLLDGRAVRIHALDVDAEGPALGARAVAALRGPGAPLDGLDVALAHAPYDWTRPDTLGAVLAALPGDAPVVAVSSEGALLEYADDACVVANLAALRDLTPADTVVAASATGDGEVAALLHGSGRVPLRPRSAEALAALVGRAGWRVERVIPRPACRDVLLVKAGS